MRAPVRMLDGRSVVVVVIVVLGQVDVRRWQHRGKHHGRDEQRRGGGAADPGSNHAGILSGDMNKVSLGLVTRPGLPAATSRVACRGICDVQDT